VQEDSYLIQVVRYIHKNPVKAKLVDRLSQFKWSSHKFYIGKTGKKELALGLDTNFVLGYFSRNRKRAIERYKRFMAEKEDELLEKFYGSKKQGSILGDPDFMERIKEKLIFNEPDIEVTEKRRLQGEGTLRRIKREVCRMFQVDEKYLSLGKRGSPNIARQTALALSKALSGLTLSKIGPHFGIASYRTVGTHCWRFQEKIKQDKTLEKKYDLLREICSQEKT
jgi:putative transposase